MILRVAAMALVGGLAGFALYRFVGCSTGSCPITSNPYVSVIYGVMLGVALALG